MRGFLLTEKKENSMTDVYGKSIHWTISKNIIKIEVVGEGSLSLKIQLNDHEPAHTHAIFKATGWELKLSLKDIPEIINAEQNGKKITDLSQIPSRVREHAISFTLFFLPQLREMWVNIHGEPKRGWI